MGGDAVAPRTHLCLALDVPTPGEAVAWVRRTREWFGTYKIGLQLFCSAGRSVVSAVRDAGAERVFLDLKLHDIPNTVAGAVRALADLGVDQLTIHTGGGAAMMEAAVAAAEGRLTLLGVTVLTSLDEAALAAVGAEGPPEALAVRRARLAAEVGVGGLVCSAAEVARIRAAVGPELWLVTPGIRPAGTSAGDQRRVATPAAAIRDGADLLVIGRAVTRAEDPEAVAAAICSEVG